VIQGKYTRVGYDDYNQQYEIQYEGIQRNTRVTRETRMKRKKRVRERKRAAGGTFTKEKEKKSEREKEI
jgi:hypothetical protein